MGSTSNIYFLQFMPYILYLYFHLMSHVSILASHIVLHPDTLYSSMDGLAVFLLVKKSGIGISIQPGRRVK